MTDTHPDVGSAARAPHGREQPRSDETPEHGPVVVVNPEIVERSDETVVDGEGCLSISLLIDERHDVPVERNERIRLRAQDVDGNVVERDIEGHEARVIQHELDHLDGILILDRTTREARGEALRVLRRAIT